jgi:hypothetical protein
MFRPYKYIQYTLQKHTVLEHYNEIIKLTSVQSTLKTTKIYFFVFFRIYFHSRMDGPMLSAVLNYSVCKFASVA